MAKQDKFDRIERVLIICNGKDCKKKGAAGIRKAARSTLRNLGARRSTHIVKSKCNGFCKQAPIVSLQPQNIWLSKTDEEEVQRVIEEIISSQD